MDPDVSSASTGTRQMLLGIHRELLDLHKQLIDCEREQYEELRGPISKMQLLQLLISDDYFAWLKRISNLIIRIDEATDAKVTAPNQIDTVAKEILHDTQLLLSVDESEDDFHKKLKSVMKRDQTVSLACQKLLQAAT